MATPLEDIKCRAEPTLGCSSNPPQPSMGSSLQVVLHNQGRIQWSTSRKANSAIRYTME